MTVFAEKLKQRMISRGFQDKVKQLVNGTKLGNFPKLQGCLLQSYVVITGGFAAHSHSLATHFTDYLSTALQKDHEELESTWIVIWGGVYDCVVNIFNRG